MVKTKQASLGLSDLNVINEDRLIIRSNNKIQIFTIGFTKKNLKEFIQLLKNNCIEKVVDIRLRPYGQLAGYSNKEDLRYVLEEYEKIKYQHEIILAPTNELLDNYRKDLDWIAYEKKFCELLRERKVEKLFNSITNGFIRICLLCSEDKPEKCHRRLVAEYFSQIAPNAVEIKHITKDDLEMIIDDRNRIVKHVSVLAESDEVYDSKTSKSS
jgi:uncharacterized protein (DUF488 family)